MKIVILDGYTLNPGDLSWEQLFQLGDCVVYDRTPEDQIVSRLQDAEICLTNKTIISKHIFAKLPRLKYVGILATGYDVVDIDAAKSRDIIVTNVPSYGTSSVAQMVFAHILNFSNRVELHSNQVKNGYWQTQNDFCFWSTPQIELSGKTLGIIGFGNIGREVSKIGTAFGMSVIFYNRPHLKKDINSKAQQSTLENIFQQSDFISLNCPLTDETKNIINKGTLSLMKPTAFIINTSRGMLVNENDLALALNNEKIAGAGIDVLSAEPPMPDNPLLNAKNCFITPHIAWATKEARQRLMNVAITNIRSFLIGKPVNVI